ncbi:hypothetical protein POM88_020109 [Heracleum sosnowskyi]|uniref:Disease resistance protein At4g27190-like leucine-rich repeats domain-containing protein n=1 Tax=Heracleum sosnowskyi TaxID=360622 RepID=A0AAD8IAX8_9APIA|nr:hypothetical protein POM88_020109 [Heracleum sosnowskyi]
MVAFPNLEILHLKKLNNISDIWGKNYNNNSSLGGYNDAGIIVFPRLTELELCDLPNLIDSSYGSGQPNSCKVAFPNLVQFNLQNLEVNLEWMELGRDDSTCKLKSLSISYEKEKQLPYTWKDQLSNLESLIVKHCFSDMLKSRCFFKELKVLQVNKVECSTLFSFSVLRSLQQLQELQISNCTLLEEIVEDVTGDEASSMVKNTITLFQLKSVVLEELPKLRSFIHGANYELQMPNILSIKVTNCGLSTLFTCSIFHKLQLKALSVYNCKLLEGIVADEKGFEISGTDDKIITVSGLSSIILVDLPKLRSFIHGANYELHMPDISSIEVTNCGLSTLFTCSIFQKLQLKTLLVYNCKFLEGIVADEKGIEISGTDDKIITVSRLSSVILVGLPNLKNFIQGTNYELHFPVLKFLQVKSCGLSNLFPLSVFQELQELKYLMVSGCNLLEGIVVDGRGIRTSNSNDKIITLPELLSVELDHLPNLKGFSLAVSYTFNVPKLYNFKVHNSPLLENITSLRTSTGLVKVHFEWNKWQKVPALNDFTNQNNKTLDSAKHQPLEASFYFFPWSCPWAY